MFERIEPALCDIEAEKKVIQSDKYKDFTRWKCNDQRLIDKIGNAIDSLTAIAVKYNVSRYGSDTESLLHYVYSTEPMVHAAPHEYLDFTTCIKEQAAPVEDAAPPVLSLKKQKKRKEKIADIKQIVQEKMAKKREEQEKQLSSQPLPRYDDVFFQGIEVLERLAGDEVAPQKKHMFF